MIDLTPLDVRKKRGDFSNKLRGYDPQEVDSFLETVAARLEELVRENLRLEERSDGLQQQVSASAGREQAVHEALVTAQELRADVKEQARREAELIEREARARIDGLVADAEKLFRDRVDALAEVERHRIKFLKTFRSLLERELDAVEVEEGRAPLEDVTVDIELGGVWSAARESVGSDAGDEGIDADDLPDPKHQDDDETELDDDEPEDDDNELDDESEDDEDEMNGEDEVADDEEDVADDEVADNAEAVDDAEVADDQEDSRPEKSLWLYDLNEDHEGRD